MSFVASVSVFKVLLSHKMLCVNSGAMSVGIQTLFRIAPVRESVEQMAWHDGSRSSFISMFQRLHTDLKPVQTHRFIERLHKRDIETTTMSLESDVNELTSRLIELLYEVGSHDVRKSLDGISSLHLSVFNAHKHVDCHNLHDCVLARDHTQTLESPEASPVLRFALAKTSQAPGEALKRSESNFEYSLETDLSLLFRKSSGQQIYKLFGVQVG